MWQAGNHPEFCFLFSVGPQWTPSHRGRALSMTETSYSNATQTHPEIMLILAAQGLVESTQKGDHGREAILGVMQMLVS